MRTKRGGYKQARSKQGKSRVRIKATGAANPPKTVDYVRLATISGVLGAPYGGDWRNWGPDKLLEPPKAGLMRILKRRAPQYLWA